VRISGSTAPLHRRAEKLALVLTVFALPSAPAMEGIETLGHGVDAPRLGAYRAPSEETSSLKLLRNAGCPTLGSMTDFLRQALRLLQDQQAPHGLRAVAAGTLLTAFEREVETPAGAAIAVWNWLATVGGDTINFSKVNFIPGYEVVCQAVAVLKAPDTGADLQHLAITVIENSSDLSVVGVADVLAIVDGEPQRDRARRVVWFVEALHERNGLPSALLRALRDRWAASVHLHLRERSVEIAALLDGPRRGVRGAIADRPFAESPKRRGGPSGGCHGGG